jgi:cell division protein FtsA
MGFNLAQESSNMDVSLADIAVMAKANTEYPHYGNYGRDRWDCSETIEVEGVGGRKARVLPRKELADVLEARAEETLNLIANDIRMSGMMAMMGSGLVLTGGASQLDSLIEMGEFIFDLPVRRGLPTQVGGLTDVVKGGEFATAVGLLLYGFSQKKEAYLQAAQHGGEVHLGDSFEGVAKKVKDFFGQIF